MRGWGVMAVAALWGGCSEPPAQDIVARIGEQKIWASSFEEQGQRLLAGAFHHVETVDDEVRRQLLDIVMSRELLLQEARHRGLEAPDQSELAQFEAQLLRRELFTTSVHQPVTVTDAGIDSLGRAEDWDQEIRFRHIMLSSTTAARKVVGQLRQGTDFSILAANRSTHRPTARRGGDMGWVPVPEMLPGAMAALEGLAPGQIHMEPVATPFGVHVFQLTGRRRVEPAAHRLTLQTLYEIRQHQAQVERFLDSLSVAEDLRCGSVGTDPVCVWGHGQMTTADLDSYLRYELRSSPTNAQRESQRLEAARRMLATSQARRLGLDRSPGVQDKVEQRRTEFLGARIEAEETRDAAVTEAQIQTYYDDHPEEYGARPSALIREILVSHADTARVVRMRLDEGEDAEALAIRYNERISTRERRGHIRIVLRDNAKLGLVAPLALDGQVGEIHGPVEVPGGYAVFIIEDRQPLPRRSLASARLSIATILRVRERNRIMNALIDSLTSAAADRLIIYEDVLATTLTRVVPPEETSRRSVWED